jgi:hypothetical protein
MKKNNDFGIDYEMYAFLKEHFTQGALVAYETIRDQIVKEYELTKEQEALTKDFKNGWLAAYQHIIKNLDQLGKNGFLGNYLTDEEQFDKLFKKFQDAFPRSK